MIIAVAAINTLHVKHALEQNDTLEQQKDDNQDKLVKIIHFNLYAAPKVKLFKLKRKGFMANFHNSFCTIVRQKL